MAKKEVPDHVGMILDGNRRFSRRLMLEPWKGHEFGAEKVEKLLTWAQEIGIKELTLFVLSTENFKRPKEEFNFLMNLFRKEFDRYIHDERFEKEGIRVNVIGRKHVLPEDIQEKIEKIMDKTKDNDKFVVNFAMAYGGRPEIIDAVKKIVKQAEEGKLKDGDIDEDVFSDFLYMKNEPDLVIRTSGERRTSGFLLWQASYSELYFCDKLWPEFEKEDLVRAVDEYRNRDRRFGK